MTTPRREERRCVSAAEFRWPACALALTALAMGCSPTTAGNSTPRLATAQGAAAPLALSVSSRAPSMAPAVAPTPAAAVARVPVDVMERELGTASDGGYLAYPAY